MKVTKGPLTDLLIFTPKVFYDERGYFLETYKNEYYRDHGLPLFVQDNLSHSKRHVLRGLHYQSPHAQGKLVSVTRGEVWDVVVDIRRGSPTFAQWFGITLSEQNHIQLYVPPGFAHGFCVLSQEADFAYKCSDYYAPDDEHGIAWNDPDLKIEWPIATPILNQKDAQYASLHRIPETQLPVFGAIR